MSRDFTPSDLEDAREPVSGTRGQFPARETRHQEQDRNPDRPIHVDRDSQNQRDPLPTDARSPASSRVLYERDRAHKLRSSQVHTLSNLAKFRVIATVIATDDLAKYSYRDDREGMQQDVRKLIRQGLLRRGTFAGPDANPRELLTLTKTGRRLMRQPAGSRTSIDLPRLRQTERSAPRCRSLPALSERGRKNPRKGW